MENDAYVMFVINVSIASKVLVLGWGGQTYFVSKELITSKYTNPKSKIVMFNHGLSVNNF